MNPLAPAIVIVVVLTVLLIGLVLVAAILAKLSRLGVKPLSAFSFDLKGRQPDTTAYEAAPSLLTPAERSFFGALQQALPSEYHICPKVRLADIIRPAKQPSRSGWQRAFNRIAAKHVDFAICDPGDLAVLGVIELDDRTHQRFEKGFRDNMVDTALSSAGIQVIRVPARKFYSPDDLKDQVLNPLKRPAAATVPA